MGSKIRRVSSPSSAAAAAASAAGGASAGESAHGQCIRTASLKGDFDMATYKFLLWHVPVTMVVNVRVDASKAMINLMTMLIAVQRGTDLQFASRNR